MSFFLGATHFKEGQFYMHTSCIDMCVEVIRVLEHNSRFTRFVVKFWRVTDHGMPWLLTEETKVMKVLDANEREWQIFDMEMWCEFERRGMSQETH